MDYKDLWECLKKELEFEMDACLAEMSKEVDCDVSAGNRLLSLSSRIDGIARALRLISDFESDAEARSC